MRKIFHNVQTFFGQTYTSKFNQVMEHGKKKIYINSDIYINFYPGKHHISNTEIDT